MCDMVDEVPFAEVNGDLAVGWAFLEDPRALLLARWRHRCLRLLHLSPPSPHITRSPGHIWGCPPLHSGLHDHPQFSRSRVDKLLSCHHDQHNMHVLKYKQSSSIDARIWLPLFSWFWNWNFEETQPPFLFQFIWIEPGLTVMHLKTNYVIWPRPLEIHHRKYMSCFVFLFALLMIGVLPCLKNGKHPVRRVGKVLYLRYTQRLHRVHNEDKLIR